MNKVIRGHTNRQTRHNKYGNDASTAESSAPTRSNASIHGSTRRNDSKPIRIRLSWFRDSKNTSPTENTVEDQAMMSSKAMGMPPIGNLLYCSFPSPSSDRVLGPRSAIRPHQDVAGYKNDDTTTNKSKDKSTTTTTTTNTNTTSHRQPRPGRSAKQQREQNNHEQRQTQRRQ